MKPMPCACGGGAIGDGILTQARNLSRVRSFGDLARHVKGTTRESI